MPRDARSTARNRPAARKGPAGRPSGRSASGASSRPPRRSSSTPAAAGRARARSPRSMRRMTVLGVLLVFLAVLITPTLRSYLAQRSQLSDLQQQVASQQKSVGDLRAQKDRWSDPAYVRQQAQSRLGFVKPGQTLKVIVDPNGTVRSTTTDSGIRKSSQPWYGQVWQSVVQTGAKK
ncbi:septum formation initiator family protein [Calidifontibacter sp. DB0510]|uniref:Septum formation initiator family protein n=1 Tax=Metallococcus carri TaxID=1656884 RepID=A0A967B4W2_9MICO|nr:septum formation initiator family protein [Metallococcus carri]NHN55677.1 septum formation initiator family protein [Metallococcus carri]NOP38139.1 septum formation initiator family protein [Calidifontibacter sp. DB2511S]